MRKDAFSDWTNEEVFLVLELFLTEVQRHLDSEPAPVRSPKRASGKHKKPPGPVHRVVQTLEQLGWSKSGLREKIYPLLWEGIQRGFVTIKPPRQRQLEEEIASLYDLPDRDRIHVVPVRGKTAIDNVALAGAQLVVELIHQVHQTKDRAHVAWGAGSTSKAVARHLARLLQTQEKCPPLTLHALTSGFRVDEPDSAPVTFFGFFDDKRLDVEYVGLFSEPVVRCRDYEAVKQAFGVKSSFHQARDIDICISSLAYRHDDHGGFKQFLEAYRDVDAREYQATISYLEQEKWIADVQYLPYGEHGAIPLTRGIRAVTLFELDQLVERVRKPGKYAVLLAGPCGVCGQTRTGALIPLLRQPSLRVWSHLVCDVQTAEELVREGRT
jgi:hypothetical protein